MINSPFCRNKSLFKAILAHSFLFFNPNYLTETEIIQKVYVEEINKTLLIDPYTHEVIHLLNLPGIGTSVSRIIALIGLFIVIIGLVEVLILKKWGTKKTESK